MENLSEVELLGFKRAKLSKLNEMLASDQANYATSYKKYSREQILNYLKNPRSNSKNLIEASNYLYTTSMLYQRIVEYFATMPTYDYVVTPVGNTDRMNAAKVRTNYYDTIRRLDVMDLRSLGQLVTRVALREGVFYGVEISTDESYFVWRLPYNYCKVVSWEDGCPLFAFDLSFFSGRELLKECMPTQLKKAYEGYKAGERKSKWYDMPGEFSICILADETLDYVCPPLAGSFTDCYLVEDFKDLAKSKEEIELYKLLSLKVPLDDDGRPKMPEPDMKKYYNQMAGQLPDLIGLALNPFTLDEVSFDRTTADRDATLRAERDLWSTVGISSLLFNNDKASSSALLQSIANDYAYVRPIVKSFERWVNKKLKIEAGTIRFKVLMPDVTIYNRTALADSLRKDMQYGLPCRSLLAAIHYGYTPLDVLGQAFLENEVLDFNSRFKVPVSANTVSVSEQTTGRPESQEPLSESGEKTREAESNKERV